MSKYSIEQVEEASNSLLKEFTKDTSQFAECQPKKIIEIYSENIIPDNYITHLTNAIKDLEIISDESIGITRYLSVGEIPILGAEQKEAKQGEKVIIRDATSQNQELSKYIKDEFPASYAKSMATTARGACKIIELSDLEQDKKMNAYQNVLASLKESTNNIDSQASSSESRIKEVREFESDLLYMLQEQNLTFKKQGIEDSTKSWNILKRNRGNGYDLKKMLNDMRDAENLKEEQNHICTITKGLNDESEKIATFTTRIQPLSDAQKVEFVNIKNNKSLPKWYSKLKPYQKLVVKSHIDELIEGKTIPTQLRYIPGLRNSFLENSYEINDNNVIQFDRAIRTGTPSYFHNQKIGQEITNQNIKHIEDLSSIGLDKGVKRDLTIQTLNYAKGVMSLFGSEGFMCASIEKACDSKTIKYENVSVGNMYNKADMIENITGNSRFNKNALIVQTCKSGKDRTGFSRILRQLSCYAKHKNKTLNDTGLATVSNRIWSSNHATELASGYGCTHGSQALKGRAYQEGSLHIYLPVPVTNIPKDYKHLFPKGLKGIIRGKLAGLNKVKGDTSTKSRKRSSSTETTRTRSTSLDSDQNSSRKNSEFSIDNPLRKSSTSVETHTTLQFL